MFFQPLKTILIQLFPSVVSLSYRSVVLLEVLFVTGGKLILAMVTIHNLSFFFRGNEGT